MRYYMVDPDNEERLLKIPRHVVSKIKSDAEHRHPDIPIREDHHPLCFPAIRDVRIGDWGATCFTCIVLGLAEQRAITAAVKRLETTRDTYWAEWDRYWYDDAIRIVKESDERS